MAITTNRVTINLNQLNLTAGEKNLVIEAVNQNNTIIARNEQQVRVRIINGERIVLPVLSTDPSAN